MASDQPAFTVTIPSHLAYVGCARAFIVAVCKAHGVDDTTTEAMALAVHEAITNIIRHGHCHRHEKPIQVSCYPRPDRIEIDILDQAEPFDLAAVPNLDPAELRVGGRGVYLMRALFDQVSCQPRADGGNQFKLVKFYPVKFPEAAPAQERAT